MTWILSFRFAQDGLSRWASERRLGYGTRQNDSCSGEEFSWKCCRIAKEKLMENNTRRSFFGKIAAMTAIATGAPKLFAAQQAPAAQPTPSAPRRGGNHVHDGIYYFSGTGANDGYPKED